MRAAAIFVCLASVSAPLSATDNVEMFDSGKAMQEEQALAAAWKSFFERTGPTLPLRTALPLRENIVVIDSGAVTNACASREQTRDERT